MGYIITVDVYTKSEPNWFGNICDVDARILSKNGDNITFDVQGDFNCQKELTKKICNTLIDAGFIEFNISHSY